MFCLEMLSSCDGLLFKANLLPALSVSHKQVYFLANTFTVYCENFSAFQTCWSAYSFRFNVKGKKRQIFLFLCDRTKTRCIYRVRIHCIYNHSCSWVSCGFICVNMAVLCRIVNVKIVGNVAFVWIWLLQYVVNEKACIVHDNRMSISNHTRLD